MKRSLVLKLYLFISRFTGGMAERRLNKRLAIGKEDANRLPERLGNSSVERPSGTLVWFHAASVGESLSILDLANRMLAERPDMHCLITTGTVTSARTMASRMSERMIHQFVPVDTRAAVKGFLDHWRPDLAVWTESEFWPVLINTTHERGIPMALVNARMSKRSFGRWRMLKKTAKSIVGCFAVVTPQDEATARYLKSLGVDPDRMGEIGSLKESASPLPYDEYEHKAISRSIAGRATWLAASTHPGEEEVISDAHHHARLSTPELLLILAPRHPERGDELVTMLEGAGWNVARRSKNQHIKPSTDVFLADTIGEMGLWYRLAPVTFLGGSLVTVGGHNPYEPAALGSAIIHGPHVFNFEHAFSELGNAGACIKIADAKELPDALDDILIPENSAKLATAAWDACSDGEDIAGKVMERLLALLPQKVAN